MLEDQSCDGQINFTSGTGPGGPILVRPKQDDYITNCIIIKDTPYLHG
jgi:hypothetical protein